MNSSTVTVNAACGRLEGRSDHGISRFMGIPFGEALRWQAPRAVAPWTGIRKAFEPAEIAPQNPNALDSFIGKTPAVQGEACLNLNVFTPGLDGPARPVMVWIHGGAFVTGSGCFKLYDGAHLASRGAVVVTINYRLGALGFLRLMHETKGGINSTGSEGIADQILALKWVRDNIAAFGGDPGNVTVFGESAGAMGVAFLLAAPDAKGLFHKAILQSGAGHIGRPEDHGDRVAHAFLKHLDVTATDTRRLLNAPMDAVLKAQADVIAEVDNARDPHKLKSMPFQPVANTSLRSRRPIESVQAGAAHGIPMIIGTTTEEWKLWTALDTKFHTMDEERLGTWATRMFGDHAADLLAAEPHGSPYERYVAMQTDRAFREPALRLLAAQSQHADVYEYVFDWRSPAFNGAFGACHAMELGFVFGTHGLPNADQFFGASPEAEAVSAAMMDAWVSFARTGRPTATGLETWPNWTKASPAAMVFGADSRPGHVSRFDLEQAWHTLPDALIGP